MDGKNLVWLISVKMADRRLLAISEQNVAVGDVVRIEFKSAINDPVLGEVIAVIQTERGSELYKWLIDASERNVTCRKVSKIWPVCQA